MARRALLTGFEPFRHWTRNSSEAAARLLASKRPGLSIAILPVDHQGACTALDDALERTAPDVLLLTGLADEARARLELRARRPAHVAAGAPLLHGLWPWAAALDAMRAAGAPARLSLDAGRYVCETIYWHALSRSAAGRIAFLHLPPLSGVWPEARLAATVASCLEAASDSGVGGARSA